MGTFRINFKSKIHLLTSKDQLRPGLNQIYFHQGWMYATNGHVMGKQKIESNFCLEAVEYLNGHCISASLYEKLLKYKVIQVKEKGVITALEDGYEVKYQLRTFHAEGETRPKEDFDYLMPNFDAVIPTKDEEVALNCIGINLNLLNLINKARIEDIQNFKIQFHGKNKGVILTPSDGSNDEIYLCMPCMLSGN